MSTTQTDRSAAVRAAITREIEDCVAYYRQARKAGHSDRVALDAAKYRLQHSIRPMVEQLGEINYDITGSGDSADHTMGRASNAAEASMVHLIAQPAYLRDARLAA